MTPEQQEQVSQGAAQVIPPLLQVLTGLAFCARNLHPPYLAELAEVAAKDSAELAAGRASCAEVEWPEALGFYQHQLLSAADYALEAVERLQQAGASEQGAMQGYAALRKHTRAVEALYPLSDVFEAVSRFYFEPDYGDMDQLQARWLQADRQAPTGVMHAANSRKERGGLSIYVPEHYDGSEDWPLVVALHGGSGHGADTLWSWLREARSRGFILLSPTSQDQTWSLMGEDRDAATVNGIVERAAEQWRIDTSKVLLTGMSDGATYSLLNGLRPDSCFTHLAPISGTFHPMLIAGMGNLAAKKIYLVHGVLDWMFPVAGARENRDALLGVGAQLVYRELEDLSHTYPREENSKILDWFLAD